MVFLKNLMTSEPDLVKSSMVERIPFKEIQGYYVPVNPAEGNPTTIKLA